MTFSVTLPIKDSIDSDILVNDSVDNDSIAKRKYRKQYYR